MNVRQLYNQKRMHLLSIHIVQSSTCLKVIAMHTYMLFCLVDIDWNSAQQLDNSSAFFLMKANKGFYDNTFQHKRRWKYRATKMIRTTREFFSGGEKYLILDQGSFVVKRTQISSSGIASPSQHTRSHELIYCKKYGFLS